MRTIHVDIVSQEKAIFSGSAVTVIATGSMGELGMQYGHAPLLTTLKHGKIKLRKEDGTTDYFYVSGGLLEVQPHCVTVLADVAEDVRKRQRLRLRKKRKKC